MNTPEIKFIDFSGGLVTSVNPILAPINSFKIARNVDLWTRSGSIKPVKFLTEEVGFPAGKSYDHHVAFSSPGIGDVIIIKMTDGDLYSFDGNSFSYIDNVNPSSVLLSIGEYVFICGKSSGQTFGEVVRKLMYFDQDLVQDFVLKDIVIKDSVYIGGEFAEILNDFIGYSTDLEFIVRVTTNYDGAESYGDITRINNILKGREWYYTVKRPPEYDGGCRVYYSFRERNSGNRFLTPQLLLDISGGYKQSYIVFTSGWITDGSFAAPSYDKTYILVWDRIYRFLNVYNTETALTELLKLYVTGEKKFIKEHGAHVEGSKVRVNSKEFRILEITYDDQTLPYESFYAIKVDGIVGDLFIREKVYSYMESIESAWNPIEFGLFWDDNEFFVPVQRKYAELTTMPIDENRPDTKYTSGVGDAIAFAGNKVFIANPLYTNVQSPNNSVVMKDGFVSWNWISGEGRHVYWLIPDTNLLSPPISGEDIIDLFSWQDTLFILQKSGISRLKIDADGVSLIQTARYGVQNKYQYYVDENNLFLVFGGRVYAGAIDKANYETGKFDFLEISKSITNLLDPNADYRLAYNFYNDALYLSETYSQGEQYICSFYSGKPTWVSFVNDPPLSVYGNFLINGKMYFIARELLTGTFGIYTDKGIISSFVHVVSNDYYFEMENAFVKKVEVLYKKTNGHANFHLVLDGVEIINESLPNKYEVDFHEIKIPQKSKSRFNRISWEIDGSGLSEDFEICGVFINRGTYGSEYLKGY